MMRSISIYPISCAIILAVTAAYWLGLLRGHQEITTDQLRSARVIGALGQPIGSCFQIKATITHDAPTGTEYLSLSGYRLKVSHVDGRPLQVPVTYAFYVSGKATPNVKLASDEFELHKLVMGKEAEHLNEAEIAQIEDSYVGKTFSLIVYEDGLFTGRPEHSPGETGLNDNRSFGFYSSLVVMDQLP